MAAKNPMVNHLGSTTTISNMEMQEVIFFEATRETYREVDIEDQDMEMGIEQDSQATSSSWQ
ncbi:11692_t:CDS:1, partial [Acaulospora colombiana]